VPNAECGVREWLYSLVKVEVLAFKILVVTPGRRPALHGRKKACLGHYKKRIFRPLEKSCFFAEFENEVKTLVWINEDRGLVKFIFFVFLPKRVKNRLKKISCQTYRRLQIQKSF